MARDSRDSLYEPLSIHRSELLNALVDVVKLEFKVCDMRNKPRDEDFSKFYACQSALDEKCRALSCIEETKRSELELRDYLDRLMAWSDRVLSIISKYMEAQAPKHWLDFGNTYQGNNAVHSMEYFTLWIRHLEKRISISQVYLKTISRREHPTGLSGIASNDPNFGMGETREDSMLQDSEIREPEDPTSECSELLRRVREFYDCHSSHKASLTAVADAVQGVVLEKEKTQAHPAIEDPEVFKAQVRTETTQVLNDQMPGILDEFRAKAFLQSLTHREEVYENVWESMVPIFDITESICTRMYRGRRPATFQSN